MRLGGEMDDRIDGVFDQGFPDQGTIADVPADESVPVGIGQVLQVFQAAGVGQGVQGDDVHARLGPQQVANEIRADETSAPGDEHILHESPSLI
jgi:uncharacterized protein YidB (DUF937 family)